MNARKRDCLTLLALGLPGLAAMGLGIWFSVYARGPHGGTLLHFAARWRQAWAAQLLLKAGADVNARNYWGDTPLHEAASFRMFADEGPPDEGREAVAEVLLAHGADINAKDYYGRTPWRIVMGDCSFGVAELLLRHGADINEVDETGSTMLHWAIGDCEADLVEQLLVHGARTDICGPDHVSEGNKAAPLDLAIEFNRPPSAKVLIYYGAQPGHCPGDNIGVSGKAEVTTSGRAKSQRKTLRGQSSN